jgi:hypothetical protein
VNPDVLLAMDAAAHPFEPHCLVERAHNQIKRGDDDVGGRRDRSRPVGGVLIPDGRGKGGHPLAVDDEVHGADRAAEVFCRRRHIAQIVA